LPDDPRRYRRYDAAFAVELSSQGRLQLCQADDLGAGGCRVQLLFPLARGAMVRVRLRSDRVGFEAAGTATIAWAAHDPPYKAGLAFSEHMIEDATRFMTELLGPVAVLTERKG
jgi:hypothetical protein